MAHGELAPSNSAAQAERRPPARSPAAQSKGSVAVEMTPERARTAKSLCPRASIQ